MGKDALRGHLESLQRRKEQDAQAFAEHDEDLCMLCHAHGEDKRSLRVSCFYDVKEVLPEALYVQEGTPPASVFYLRICKACRGRFLQLLAVWRESCLDMRRLPKDHDGNVIPDEERCVPIRVLGATHWITRAEYAERYPGREPVIPRDLIEKKEAEEGG